MYTRRDTHRSNRKQNIHLPYSQQFYFPSCIHPRRHALIQNYLLLFHSNLTSVYGKTQPALNIVVRTSEVPLHPLWKGNESSSAFFSLVTTALQMTGFHHTKIGPDLGVLACGLYLPQFAMLETHLLPTSFFLCVKLHYSGRRERAAG